MKKKVFSLMMMLLLAFTGFVRADELTVNDGTTTNAYVPVYGFYADAYLKCEFVQPAADLAAMNGATINGVTFYASQSSVDWGSANFQVFLTEVANTTISAFNGPGTVVYEGALSISGGEMAVTFTTPYTYNGGNLLVGVYNTVTGSYVSCSWYGVSATGASVQGYDYSSLSGVTASQRDFLPKMMIDYTPAGGGGGGGETVEVTIGDPTSTTTNSYLPTYSLYEYSFTQQIYTADEIGVGGTINSFTMWLKNSSSYARNLNIYMKEVSESTFASGSSWVSMASSDMVATFTLANDIASPVETTITLSTPFEYSGNGNLVICVQDVTGSWSSGAAGVQMTTDVYQALYAYRDGTVYDPANPGSGTLHSYKNVVRLSITTAGGGGGPVDVLFALQDGEVVETIEVGPRPIGCWMEPFTFQLRNDGPATTLNLIDFTPTDYFTVVAPELPVAMAHNEEIDVQLTTGTSTDTLWQMVAIYGEGRTARVWDIVAEPYTPGVPDVVETAYDLGTVGNGFSYQGVPSQITPTVLHNDYTLPFPEIEEGEDAVYKFTVAQDMIINAYVDTVAENGKVALYTEDFYGEGGPMAGNYYQGLDLSGTGGGGAAGAPFEAQIGEGTSSSGYFPFYSLYNYSLSAELFLAAELAEAGVTTAPFTSLSWNATNSITQDQNNITIWMANVADTQVPATSPLASGMTKVYTGNLTQPTPTGWVEFVFNEGSFSWDGSSNILILCQRNNGSWTSSISWQYHNPGFQARGYDYTDNAAYNAETTQYSWYTSSTTRANIIMKGGNREGNRDVVTEGFEGGSLPAGWTMSNCHSSTGVTNNYTAHSGDYEFRFYYSTNPPQYLISPELTGTENGVDVSFYYMTYLSSYPETFQVGYSTTTNDVSAFTFGSTVTALNDDAYMQYSESFPAGTKYVAVKYTSNDQFYLFLDDFTFTTTSGGGQGGGSTAWNVSAGPVIENLGLTPGTYYLVASATEADYEVFINVDNMPCPAIDAEGFAFNPYPADDEDGIEPGSVTLRWMNPQYTTGWRLIFGTTYYPDPNHPQTIIYPEDGSFSTDMANSYTVRNLWNNTNYFWRVEFINDGCPDGVSSPIWGFTTHLNIPQNLTAVDETVFNDETITLNWNAVVDRTYRMYNVYRDGVCIGHTTVNNIGNTTYTDGPLSYNMGGYVYYVTAVYDEGESAPSNTVTVKVSGRGNVDGHVYEQDGIAGIAGATVTMIGQDEFGVSHTYNFTTDGQGYYSGAVYAGTYNGSAGCDGYQTIYEPVQGNPIAIVYNQTTSPIDYMLDENFDPVCGVIAEYYPDSLNPESPYVKVYWGCGLPGSEIIEDFETGDFSKFEWQVDSNYPWSITTTNPYEGTYCMKSGGAGVASVTSNMTVTVEIPADGEMSFFGKISSESNYDYGHFYIDGVEKGNWSGAGNWTERTYAITAGTHTFQWRYTKDSSVNSNDDCFYVDYINFYKQPEPPVPGMTYDFENSTMQGWTSLDADGDGYGWYVASDIMSTGYGHNGSNDCVLSQSYYSGLVLYPDNYLVSPQVPLGGTITFYACAQDNLYAAEHFGVAISTTSNTTPSAFTMLNEWTMTAKKAEGKSMDNAVADVNFSGVSRDGKNRAQGNWYQYTVDLSAYAGQTGYVAIRHFNCSDMFYLDVDDITISDPSKSAPASRSFSHYRVYRTNCYNDGPYTLLDETQGAYGNTRVLSCEVTDTVYIDTYWNDPQFTPAGVYKWGVGVVYVGNRGEEIAGPIHWAAPVVRNATADNDPNPVAGEEGVRAPWDLLATFTAPEAAQYGVVTDGQYIYTSNWGYASAAHNFYKYDMQGNMIEGFEIPGCGTLRGMTFDGQYVYGVANSSTVYCVDLNNHTLINTFTSAYGAQRGITYDPERDGFWVIGNWSGDLTLINRQGAIVTTGPTPTSVSDLAYYKDENNVEHVFCFNNGDNGVYDYNITTNTLGGSVFNLSATPGFNSGTSGGCHVAEYNGKVAFFGDLQQDPNLIGIYELRDGSGPVPPTPGTEGLQEPRESEIVWSNCLDKNMYLHEGDVTVNVLLNSADSPEGIKVTFTNYNEAEQELYPIEPIILDETGYYAFESFRKGEYKVNIEFEGYYPMEDSVSIWEPTDLRYVMTEIIYGVSDLYVSSTGWAMWDNEGIPSGGGGGGGQGGNTTFTEGFEGGLNGWNVLTVNADGGSWIHSNDNLGGYDYTTLAHGGTGFAMCYSFVDYVGSYDTDSYMYTPQKYDIVNGSTLTFWADNANDSYPESFSVCVATADNPSAADFTQVWSGSAKGNGGAKADVRHDANRYENWRSHSIDLSAYAGQSVYIAFHDVNYDMYEVWIDDVELSTGAKNAEEERHLESFKVMCESLDHEPIFNANVPADQPFCQLATEELVPGDHYICKVAAMYSTGMSAWTECEWQYIPCTEYAGTVNGVTIEGNEISWDYPGGGGGGGGGQGSAFSYDLEAGLPAGWNVIDANNDGYTWCLTSNIPNTWTYYAGMSLDWYHSGTNAICSGSYINGVGALTPDEYLVSEQVNLVNGSTFSFYAAATDASYAADHFGVFVSDNGTSGWEMVNEWTLTGKGGAKAGDVRASRDGNGLRLGNWYTFSADLSAYAGQQKYIAIRHFNCTDQYIMCVDDIELTNGAKGTRAEWSFFNGYVTDPGAMANGADASWIKGSQSTWGPNVNNGGGYMLADSFTLDAATTIDQIEVYGYQTGSSTTSTFTGLYAQIYNGSPMSGGTAIWGDINTNIMTATAFTNCYRGSDGETTATTRPIMSITAGGLNIELEAGTYYLVYSLAGSGSSGPWGAPHAEPSIGNTGNGLQYTTAWQTLTDSGAGTPYGCAMLLHGSTGGSGPTPTGDVLGAMIFADGEWEAFVEYPTNTYTYEGEAEEVCVRIVYNGTNTLPEGNIYFSMSCPECEPYMPGTIICDAGEPIHGEQVDANHVKVWWGEEPIVPGAGEWYFYDNGVNEDAIGTNGGNFWWGVMFPAGSYEGNMVTKVAAYDYMAMTGDVTIYNDGTTSPVNAVGQMNVTMTGSEDFVEYEFAEPVVIDPTKNVWVVFYNGSGATFPASVCANTGDANGRWVSLDGNTWEDLAGYGLDYTFMIRAYIAQGAKGEVREIAIEQPAGDGGVLAVSGNGARVSRNRASLVKYNVYRSADNVTYEFIGEVAEDGSGYYEYIDSPTVAGTYYYQVRAYYDNECESEPAKAYDNPTVDYVMLNTTAAGVDENDGMAIFPNPTKGNVMIQAAGMQHITVVSVLGQVVYDADVTGDELILNMSKYTAGMYTVRVMTENGVRVERITVIR